MVVGLVKGARCNLQSPGPGGPGAVFQHSKAGQSIALKWNSPPSFSPEGQREVTVLVWE